MDWSMLGGAGLEILKAVTPFIAIVLTIALSGLAKKNVQRLGIERSKDVDDMIDKYVGIGVNYVKRVAEKKLDGRELDKKDKLALATKTVLGELDQSGLKGIGEDLIKARIENWLEVNKTPAAGN